ncbi:phosphatase PAP2 family protein [Halovivax gelatinilyticus]|uniref:phosphatase PAP2 family protein n=1 Tax=Halovivax gelatinilyticus TaxID=2961597 RepID=UPI0020CA7FBA|nr:phosphatase PAP2 family protein [Halovivax gelatinilyticus]
MWFDSDFVRAAGELSPTWLILTLAVLSFLGSAVLIVPMVTAWYLRGDRNVAAPMLGAVAFLYAVMTTSKAFASTERPGVEPPIPVAEVPLVFRPIYDHAAVLDTGSFPSGHALAVFVFWALLAIELDIGTRARRWATVAGIVAIVAASRIVLGAHYLGDVVGGFVVGALALVVIQLARTHVRDPTAALFGFAFVVGILGTLAGGSSPPVVAGAAIGALLCWRATEGATTLPERGRHAEADHRNENESRNCVGQRARLRRFAGRVATGFTVRIAAAVSALVRGIDIAATRTRRRSPLRLAVTWGAGGVLALGAIGVVGATGATIPSASLLAKLDNPVVTAPAAALGAAAVIVAPTVASMSDRDERS